MKNFDFKQFAIAHGEKIVLGVVGLMVLFALAKTSWSTYKKKPEEISTKAKNAETTIAQNEWPKEDQQKFSDKNRLEGKITAMLQPIPTGRKNGGVGWSVDVSYPLYIREKLKEVPVYLPVEDLTATSFTLVGAKIVATQTEGGDECGVPGMGVEGQPKFKKAKKKSGFRTQRRGAAGTTGEGGTYPGPMGMGGVKGGRAATGEGQRYNPRNPMTSSKMEEQSMAAQQYEGGCGGMGDTGGYGSSAVVEAKGLRVISVRGIYPIKKQLRAFEDALNLLKGYYESDPRQIVHILGFKLERQVSSDEGKSWSEWEEVDLKKNKEQLGELNFETDVVPYGVTHPEITSPLPERLLKFWDDEATHVRLERYKLTEAGRKRQKKLDELLAKQKELMKPRRKSSGFGDLVRDQSSQVQGLLGGMGMYGGGEEGGAGNPYARMSMEFRRNMRETFDPQGENPEAVKAFEREVTAAGDLLLFRFFDFDVLPGLAYRYRVRLELRNPLFQENPNRVKLDAQKATGEEFVNTPPSKPSNNAAIPADTHYFLTRVQQPNSPRLQEPDAELLIYQWQPELGTVVKGEVQKLKVGNFISGVDKTTTRLDPGRQELLVNAESEFETRSLLLDIMGGRRDLERKHQKELGLTPSDLKDVQLFGEAVVVDKSGELKRLDPMTEEAKQKQLEAEQKEMLTAFDGWKIDARDVAPPGAYPGGEEGYPMGDCGDANSQFNTGEGGTQGRRSRGRRGRRTRALSPLRRGSYGPGGPGYGPNSGSGGYSPYGSGSTRRQPSRRGRRPSASAP